MALFQKLMTRNKTDPYSNVREGNVGYLSNKDFPNILFQGYTRLDRHPEIVAAIDKVADLISNMTLHVYEKNDNGQEKRVRDGLARKIDVNPNNDMTRKTFINNIVRVLLLNGNQVTAVIKKYDRLNNKVYIDNLVPIESSRVSFEKTTSSYDLLIDCQKVDKDQFLHFVLNPDPDNPYKGLGHRLVLKELLDNLTIATKTKKGYMSQKFSPSMVISVQADGDSGKWKEKRDKLKEDYIKSNEAGEPMIIPSEMMKVESVSPLTLKDIAINESVEIDKRTVASILGIPPYILGVGDFERDEYNNFIENKIRSIATILQQEITRKVIFFSTSMFVRMNHHSLLDYSLTEWAEIGKSLKAIGVVTGNEVRNKTGFEFVDQEELNEFSILENYIKLEDIDKQKKLEKEGR